MPRLRDLAKPPQAIVTSPTVPQPVQPPHYPVADPVEINPFLRCTLPSIFNPSVDDLRQFRRSGTAQTRIVAIE